ncbi:MAG: PEP-CTERM sorting domain-containing protein [Rubripirellula sp.]
MLKYFFTLALCICSAELLAETVVTMPVAGSGHYDLVANGDFSAGISGWSRIQTEPYGLMAWDTTDGFNGIGAITSNPTTPRSGPGFAYQRTITGLVAGDTYILSGAFNAETLGAGALYLDMTDSIGGDTGIRPTVLGSVPSGWFFTFNEFVPSGTSANVRIIRDSYSTDLRTGGLVDEIGVTPASTFVPPVSAVPEPGTFATIVFLSGFASLSRRRKRRRNPILED